MVPACESARQLGRASSRFDNCSTQRRSAIGVARDDGLVGRMRRQAAYYKGWSADQWVMAAHVHVISTIGAANRVSEAFQHFGPSMIPAAEKLLTDRGARPYIVKILGDFGPAADSSVVLLVPLLEEPDEELQKKVLQGI